MEAAWCGTLLHKGKVICQRLSVRTGWPLPRPLEATLELNQKMSEDNFLHKVLPRSLDLYLHQPSFREQVAVQVGFAHPQASEDTFTWCKFISFLAKSQSVAVCSLDNKSGHLFLLPSSSGGPLSKLLKENSYEMGEQQMCMVFLWDIAHLKTCSLPAAWTDVLEEASELGATDAFSEDVASQEDPSGADKNDALKAVGLHVSISNKIASLKQSKEISSTTESEKELSQDTKTESLADPAKKSEAQDKVKVALSDTDNRNAKQIQGQPVKELKGILKNAPKTKKVNTENKSAVNVTAPKSSKSKSNVLSMDDYRRLRSHNSKNRKETESKPLKTTVTESQNNATTAKPNSNAPVNDRISVQKEINISKSSINLNTPITSGDKLITSCYVKLDTKLNAGVTSMKGPNLSGDSIEMKTRPKANSTKGSENIEKPAKTSSKPAIASLSPEAKATVAAVNATAEKEVTQPNQCNDTLRRSRRQHNTQALPQEIRSSKQVDIDLKAKENTGPSADVGKKNPSECETSIKVGDRSYQNTPLNTDLLPCDAKKQKDERKVPPKGTQISPGQTRETGHSDETPDCHVANEMSSLSEAEELPSLKVDQMTDPLTVLATMAAVAYTGEISKPLSNSTKKTKEANDEPLRPAKATSDSSANPRICRASSQMQIKNKTPAETAMSTKTPDAIAKEVSNIAGGKEATVGCERDSAESTIEACSESATTPGKQKAAESIKTTGCLVQPKTDSCEPTAVASVDPCQVSNGPVNQEHPEKSPFEAEEVNNEKDAVAILKPPNDTETGDTGLTSEQPVNDATIPEVHRVIRGNHDRKAVVGRRKKQRRPTKLSHCTMSPAFTMITAKKAVKQPSQGISETPENKKQCSEDTKSIQTDRSLTKAQTKIDNLFETVKHQIARTVLPATEKDQTDQERKDCDNTKHLSESSKLSQTMTEKASVTTIKEVSCQTMDEKQPIIEDTASKSPENKKIQVTDRDVASDQTLRADMQDNRDDSKSSTDDQIFEETMSPTKDSCVDTQPENMKPENVIPEKVNAMDKAGQTFIPTAQCGHEYTEEVDPNQVVVISPLRQQKQPSGSEAYGEEQLKNYLLAADSTSNRDDVAEMRESKLTPDTNQKDRLDNCPLFTETVIDILSVLRDALLKKEWSRDKCADTTASLIDVLSRDPSQRQAEGMHLLSSMRSDIATTIHSSPLHITSFSPARTSRKSSRSGSTGQQATVADSKVAIPDSSTRHSAINMIADYSSPGPSSPQGSTVKPAPPIAETILTSQAINEQLDALVKKAKEDIMKEIIQKEVGKRKHDDGKPSQAIEDIKKEIVEKEPIKRRHSDDKIDLLCKTSQHNRAEKDEWPAQQPKTMRSTIVKIKMESSKPRRGRQLSLRDVEQCSELPLVALGHPEPFGAPLKFYGTKPISYEYKEKLWYTAYLLVKDPNSVNTLTVLNSAKGIKLQKMGFERIFKEMPPQITQKVLYDEYGMLHAIFHTFKSTILGYELFCDYSALNVHRLKMLQNKLLDQGKYIRQCKAFLIQSIIWRGLTEAHCTIVGRVFKIRQEFEERLNLNLTMCRKQMERRTDVTDKLPNWSTNETQNRKVDRGVQDGIKTRPMKGKENLDDIRDDLVGKEPKTADFMYCSHRLVNDRFEYPDQHQNVHERNHEYVDTDDIKNEKRRRGGSGSRSKSPMSRPRGIRDTPRGGRMDSDNPYSNFEASQRAHSRSSSDNKSHESSVKHHVNDNNQHSPKSPRAPEKTKKGRNGRSLKRPSTSEIIERFEKKRAKKSSAGPYKGYWNRPDGTPILSGRVKPRAFKKHDPRLYKTRMCVNWVRFNGQCVEGTACPFAHGDKELREPGLVVFTNSKPRLSR